MSHISAVETRLQNLLKDKFFRIPPFQRGYVWREKQVKALWDDVHDHWVTSNGPNDTDPYFIGTLLTCTSDSDSDLLDVIDGQQRLTTLLLLIRCLMNFLEDAGHYDPVKKLSYLLSGYDVISEVERPRITVHYADGRVFMNEAIAGKRSPGHNGSESGRNLAAAFAVISDLVAETFDANPEHAHAFLKHFLTRVSVILVTSTDIRSSLKIFETINARGLDLTAADLLKNKLFEQGQKERVKDMEALWDEFSSNFSDSKQSLKFLRDCFLSIYPVEDLKESNVFTEFTKPDLFRRFGGSEALITMLNQKAIIFNRLSDGRDAKGALHEELQVLKNLAGKSSTSYIALLLTAAELNEDDFTKLVRFVSDSILYLKTMGWLPQPIKDHFSAARMQLLDAPDGSLCVDELLRSLQRFHDGVLIGIEGLRYTKKSTQNLMRHILARSYWQLERECTLSVAAVRSIKQMLAYDIEHVLPKTASAEAVWHSAFSREDYLDASSRLGNLVLLDKSSNSSAGNAAFPEKLEHYRSSNLHLTRVLAEIPSAGKETAGAKTMRQLTTFKAWNRDSILQREDDYRTVFSRYIMRAV